MANPKKESDQDLLTRMKKSSEANKQLNFSRTGCSICDSARAPYCIHKGPKGGGSSGGSAGSTENSNTENKSGKTENDQALSKQESLSVLFASFDNKDDIQDELSENTRYLPSLVPSYVIKNELENFIKELAQRKHVNTEGVSAEILAKQLGIEYHHHVDQIKISIANSNDRYEFLARLESKQMIQVPKWLQKEQETLSSTKAHKEESSEKNESKSGERFNPQPYFVRTALKLRP